MSKYKAEKCVIDGIRFDSKVEGKYYEKLKDDKAKGNIINFELQPRFTLQPNFIYCSKNYRKIEYVADFLVYGLFGLNKVIDIKGMATTEAKMKRKMFTYKYTNTALEWLVWSGGEWKDYDEVIKARAKRKREKNKLLGE